MEKIVYITGCLGFMGSYVTRMALNCGWYVRGVDKITYAANEYLLDEFSKNKNFVFEKKDINDIDFLYDCDYIINMAAETHVDNSIINNDDFIHSNINGVHHLLELIRKRHHFKMPTLLHFSTDEIYGDIISGKHIETNLLRPSNPYSATKAAGDMLILSWSRTYNVPYIIVRPTNNYGKGQYVEKLIPKACKFLKINRMIPLHQNGTPIRTWLHAADTAEAIKLIINKEIKNEIFNISGNFEQTNMDTISQILKIYYPNEFDIQKLIDSHVDFQYSRMGQDVRYSIDDTKLKLLGWAPIKNFHDELPEIVKYYKENFIW